MTNEKKKASPAGPGNANGRRGSVKLRSVPRSLYHAPRKKSRAPMLICIAFVVGLLIGIVTTGTICAGIHDYEQVTVERSVGK